MKIVKKGLKPLKPVQPIAQEDPEIPNPVEPVEIQQTTATVEKYYPDGTSTSEKVPVGEPAPVPEPHANVGVSMGMTLPTAQFANIKFTVSLFCPCEVTEDSINGTYEEVKGWVDSKVSQIHEEIQSQLG